MFLVDLITPGIMYYDEMVNLVNVIANYQGGEGSHRNDSDLKYVDWDYQWFWSRLSGSGSDTG